MRATRSKPKVVAPAPVKAPAPVNAAPVDELKELQQLTVALKLQCLREMRKRLVEGTLVPADILSFLGSI